MRIAIMQPYLFPYIGYFQLINAVDKFVVFDDVNYINKGWINRNRILVNHSAFLFTIPLKGASQNKLINEIEVDDNPKWRGKFLKTLEAGYAKAPCYNTVSELVKDIVNNPEPNLSSYIFYALQRIADFLEIKTTLIPSSKIYENQALKGEDRIIDICLREKTLEYVNPIGGQEIYTRQKFEEKGIKLFFIKTHELTYKQYDKPFVPWLSVLDLMMFCPKDEIMAMLHKCELI